MDNLINIYENFKEKKIKLTLIIILKMKVITKKLNIYVIKYDKMIKIMIIYGYYF